MQKLTKEQIKYRKEMNKLIRQGKIKNRYGETETKLFEIPEEKINLIGIWYVIIAIFLFTTLIKYANGRKKVETINQIEQNTEQATKEIQSKGKTEIVHNEKTEIIHKYLKKIEEVTLITNEVTKIINKYYKNEIISSQEISNEYEKLNKITININDAPEKADVLKYNTINVIESNKRILEYINKDIYNVTKQNTQNIFEECNKRSVFLSQQMDLVKGLLGAHEMSYEEDENGALKYTY